MWIFTRYGFVALCKEGNQWSVRARKVSHLKELSRRSGLLKGEIVTSALSDYPHRIFVGSAELKRLMTWLAADVDYRRFKPAALQSAPDGVEYQQTLYDVFDSVWNYGEAERKELTRTMKHTIY